jgi:hypothetical protein
MPKDAPPNGDAPAETAGIGDAGQASPLRGGPILVAGSTTCSPPLGSGCLNQPTAGTMESPLHGDMHGGFGERPGETDQQQCWHRAPGRLIPVTRFPILPLAGPGRTLPQNALI